ncbi:MAG TPA: RnfABCDGE type electron transport complex subunit B [Bacteroidales bacterium]|nr:RnfABCDGE type electron transport complex subunit B [Bacteroidales bacterium]
MTQIIVLSVVILGSIGAISAVVLYFVSQKFKVYEDPKIAIIADILPGANCGGCGYAGCQALAEAIVKKGTTEGISCPVGGESVKKQIAEAMGEVAGETIPQRVIVRCNGTFENAPKKYNYDSITSCAYAHMLGAGESACAYGCLGLGDCVKACSFNSIKINTTTGLPAVNYEICVLCGACVRACPRNIIEIRNIVEGNSIWVSCMNKEKGVEAKKNCKVACIACRKCEKTCEFEAIAVENNLAFIDSTKCTACMKCVAACPTGAILTMLKEEAKA